MLAYAIALQGQSPVKIWDNTIGGAGTDQLIDALPTDDGGFLLAGYSNSNVGYDKTQPSMGSTDYWLVKINSAGVVEWNKTYGTTTYDYVAAAAMGTDGNYLIVGYTTAGVSGDKTEAAIGGRDYWILKLDPAGNLIWQNTIGGTADDYPTDVMSAPGGYIISGYSASGISGDKSMASFGGSDYWIMKINNSGDIVWQYAYGGTGNDYLRKTIRLTDGTYLLGGDSDSGISGNKTAASQGARDYWLLNMIGGGAIGWQKGYGGPGWDTFGDVVERTDGGFMIVGYSSSDIGGDKTQLSQNTWVDCCDVGWGEGWWSDTDDYWVIRTEASGDLVWEKTMLSYADDYARSIFISADGRYCIAGDEWSDESPSDLIITSVNDDGFSIYSEGINGGVWYEDDEGGTIYYTNGNNDIGTAFPLPDGSFILAGSSDALIGDYKSENSLGSDYNDYWVIKMGPDTCALAPMYADHDQDGASGEMVSMVCMNNPGYTMSAVTDCDDNRSSVSPLVIEVCDGLDNDCDGAVDEGLAGCDPGPEILWDKTIGSDTLDYLVDVIETNSGYYLGGSQYLQFEEVPYGVTYDYAIRKTDTNGNVVWYHTYGGTEAEVIGKLVSCPDGGLLLAGYSSSGASGDKTEPLIGGSDCWIVKLDSNGVIEWQNTIGGSSTEYLVDAIRTTDGGYALAVSSYSGISGDKTEVSYGNYDVWIIKLSATGDIEWQNAIGGSLSDTPRSIAQTADGGYVVGASSSSGISGEKTTAAFGSSDYWIIKLYPDGSVQWQKSLGGTMYDDLNKVVVTADGQFVVFGNSDSDISLLKSEESFNYDIWVVKLNAGGSVVWENTIQAPASEYAADIQPDPAGGYILLCRTLSENGNDKWEPLVKREYMPYDNETETMNYDFWTMHIDEAGMLSWQNTIGGSQGDYPAALVVTTSGDIVCAGFSESPASSDKSEDNIGKLYEVFYDDEPYEYPVRYNTDYWIVYLDYTCNPVAETCNDLDDNCNGLVDDGVAESVFIAALGPTTFCQGGSVVLESDFTGATVQWKRNGVAIAGATSATYTAGMKGNYACVTSSDCGTAESAPLFIQVYKNPSALITAGGPTTFCAGDSVTLTANTGAGLSYQWYNGPTPIPGAVSITYTATVAGTYKCEVTKAVTGCHKLSNGIVVTVPCRLEDALTTGQLEVFPNPATQMISVATTHMSGAIEILDAQGKLVFSHPLTEAVMQLDIGFLASGVYVVRVGGDSARFIKL